MAGKAKRQKVYLNAEERKKEKLVELAAQNAELVLSQDREKLKREKKAYHRCSERNLRICCNWLTGTSMEAYDISNINGFETVGSMVVYEKENQNAAITVNSRSKACIRAG